MSFDQTPELLAAVKFIPESVFLMQDPRKHVEDACEELDGCLLLGGIVSGKILQAIHMLVNASICDLVSLVVAGLESRARLS